MLSPRTTDAIPGAATARMGARPEPSVGFGRTLLAPTSPQWAAVFIEDGQRIPGALLGAQLLALQAALCNVADRDLRLLVAHTQHGALVEATAVIVAVLQDLGSVLGSWRLRPEVLLLMMMIVLNPLMILLLLLSGHPNMGRVEQLMLCGCLDACTGLHVKVLERRSTLLAWREWLNLLVPLGQHHADGVLHSE